MGLGPALLAKRIEKRLNRAISDEGYVSHPTFGEIKSETLRLSYVKVFQMVYREVGLVNKRELRARKVCGYPIRSGSKA